MYQTESGNVPPLVPNAAGLQGGGGAAGAAGAFAGGAAGPGGYVEVYVDGAVALQATVESRAAAAGATSTTANTLQDTSRPRGARQRAPSAAAVGCATGGQACATAPTATAPPTETGQKARAGTADTTYRKMRGFGKPKPRGTSCLNQLATCFRACFNYNPPLSLLLLSRLFYMRLCLVSGLIFGLLTYTRTWLIQTHMEQKPLRWVAAGAYAVRKRPECAGMVRASAGVALALG